MLEQLKLSNLALSVQAEVDFTAGMICITGETGAGKSLVVDALGLVLGSKADANMVRQGQKQLEVSARFSIGDMPQVQNTLAAYGFLDEEPTTEALPAGSAVKTQPFAELPSAGQLSAEQPPAELSAPLKPVSVAAAADTAPCAVVAEAVRADELSAADGGAAIACGVVADGHAVGLPAVELPAVSAAAAWDAGSGAAHSAPAREGACAASSELVVRRIVTAEGKSKAYVNGHMATLTQLRQLSEHLIAIHGQHASVKLMDQVHQLEIVDNYGNLKPLVREVNAAYQRYSALRLDLTHLSEQQKQGAQEYKQDRYNLEELKRLDFHEGSFEELDALFDRVMNQSKFSFALSSLNNLIEGGEHCVLSLLRSQFSTLESVKSFDPSINKIIENLESAVMLLEDVSAQAADLNTQSLEFSATEVEQKMSKVHELARRLTTSPQELYLKTEQLQRKVDDFLGLKDRINTLTQEVMAARQAYEECAQRLTGERTRVAAQLAQAISNKIKLLALPDARFDIVLRRDDEGKPKLNGRDELCFMFSANLGQDLRPLAAVASGGELARLALAIEVLTASVKSTPTLIFDEVDTGISGRTASAVGALLQELGHYVQVITVTHLPQVAAKANTQLVVSKFNENGTVNSTITPLDDQGRIEEISRMIGGTIITETTRKSAYELLHD